MDRWRKLARTSKAARLVATIFACGLLLLSCNLQTARRDAVAGTNANTSADANPPANGNIKVEEATRLAVEAASTPTPDSPIRKIDFENFTYPFPENPQSRKKIKLHDGEQPPTQFSEYGVPHDIGYRLRAVSYGDVTGDGVEEAIVTLGLIHSGSAITSYVYIYTLRHDRPALLWSFETGDRADGGLQKVAAENGELVIELRGRNKVIGTDLYADDGDTGGACCTDFATRTLYQWRNGRFRRKGKPEEIPFKPTTLH